MHEHHPPLRFVVEDAPRHDQPDDQVVQRDGHGRRQVHHRIGEHAEHREQGEEVEVHLDLHRPLAEVHEEAAHHHRGDSVHHRERARMPDGPVRDRGSDHDGQAQPERGEWAAPGDPGYGHERGDVQKEEDQRDLVQTHQVPLLERGHLFGKSQIFHQSHLGLPRLCIQEWPGRLQTPSCPLSAVIGRTNGKLEPSTRGPSGGLRRG